MVRKKQGIAFLLVSMMLISGCGSTEEVAEESKVDVETAYPVVRTVSQSGNFIGTIEAEAMVSVTPRLTGIVTLKSEDAMKGMALVIIGGLTASTILTFFLLPTFYMTINKKPAESVKVTYVPKPEPDGVIDLDEPKESSPDFLYLQRSFFSPLPRLIQMIAKVTKTIKTIAPILPSTPNAVS